MATAALSLDDEKLLQQLASNGLLSPQQMDYTRRIGQSMGLGAPQVLRLLRLASDFDMARALASLHGLSYWLPDPVQVDPDALAQVPFAFARQHRMLPVRRKRSCHDSASPSRCGVCLPALSRQARSK